MSANAIVLEGTIKPDGPLELNEKLTLPAGRVKVTVQTVYNRAEDPFFQRMEAIWAAQRARGHVSRTKEEVDAEINALRDESEEEIQEAERLHEEGQHDASLSFEVVAGLLPQQRFRFRPDSLDAFLTPAVT